MTGPSDAPGRSGAPGPSDAPGPAGAAVPAGAAGPAGPAVPADPAVPAGATAPGEGTGPGDELSLEMITAALRADSADVAVYARVLTDSLGEALPPGCVEVDRDRSMSDRMRGRPGQVSKITVRLGDRVLTLGVRAGRPPAAEICREVRGVVLSRQPVGVQEWVGELARALVAHAQENARAAEVLRKLVTGS